MQDIENTNEEKLSALRVIVIGLIFVPLAILDALCEKNHIYAIIGFRDYVDYQMLVLDFDENIDSAQSLIYKLMLEFRKTKKFYTQLWCDLANIKLSPRSLD